MSAAVPQKPEAVTPEGSAPPARDKVSAVNASGVKAFFATLWTVIGLAIIGGYYASVRLGAPRMHPMEYPFTGAVYLLWVPLVPLLVAAARRWAPLRGVRLRNALIHAAIAVVLILAKLFAHRLVFCRGEWLECVFGIRLEPWLVSWYLNELLVYAATIGGTWAFDAMERAERRALAVAEKERELAAAELQAAHGHIAPHEMKARFASIAAALEGDPARAESMITEAADALRAAVQAIRSAR